jgi:ferredoxin/flavodoxin
MDSTVLFYFSGTGNSLIVARSIAQALGAAAFSIPSLMSQEKIEAGADVVGLVFPVYVGGIPRIVKEFVKKISTSKHNYYFAVCTYRNTTGATFDLLGKELKNIGADLAGGFAVKMPGNYIVEAGAVSAEEQQSLFLASRKKINEIVEYVAEKNRGTIEKFSDTGDAIGNFILSSPLFNWILNKINQTRDKHFYVSEQCKGCGICSKVCPVKNIEMIETKPHWLHHCEQCFACLQWCPQQAMQYKIHAPFIRPGGPQQNITENRSRYHHPEVSWTDLFNSSRGKKP